MCVSIHLSDNRVESIESIVPSITPPIAGGVFLQNRILRGLQ